MVKGAYPHRLTDREKETLELLKAGRSDEDIAEKFKIAPGTVQSTVRRICYKLGAKSKHELLDLE